VRLNLGFQANSALARAVFFMLASTVLFGFMAVTIRMASSQLHPFEIAFFRNFFGLIAALPIVYSRGLSVFKTQRLGLYGTRCFIGIVSMLASFWALVHLPMAQAIALSYSTPLFVTIGAVLLLGETVRARRWSAVIVGFIGVLIVLQPGTDDFSMGMLVALMGAVLSAIVAISIKFLSRTDSPDTIVVYTTLFWVPLSFLPALWFWQWPLPHIWPWLALSGLFGTTGHMLWTRAIKLADASVIAPISYTQLPLVAVIAYVMFDEPLGLPTVLGALVIFSANIYIARREVQVARRAVTDPDIGSEPPAPR
jgi:drug/metabolite transporter (DMT)-like permease